MSLRLCGRHLTRSAQPSLFSIKNVSHDQLGQLDHEFPKLFVLFPEFVRVVSWMLAWGGAAAARLDIHAGMHTRHGDLTLYVRMKVPDSCH
jgi:hypothetical protein